MRRAAPSIMKRRDIFIFVPKPGTADEAKKYLGEWLRSLDGHPGYLGGSVLEEVADELLPDTLVMLMEFESTEAARALWPKIENTVTRSTPTTRATSLPTRAPRSSTTRRRHRRRCGLPAAVHPR